MNRQNECKANKCATTELRAISLKLKIPILLYTVWIKEMMKLGMGSNEINEFNAKFDCNHGNRMKKNWLTIYWFV